MKYQSVDLGYEHRRALIDFNRCCTSVKSISSGMDDCRITSVRRAALERYNHMPGTNVSMLFDALHSLWPHWELNGDTHYLQILNLFSLLSVDKDYLSAGAQFKQSARGFVRTMKESL